MLWVSIVDDKNDSTWKSVLKKHQLTGVHVRATRELKNELTMLIRNAIDVYSIPHHLLYDSTGKLADKEASILKLVE